MLDRKTKDVDAGVELLKDRKKKNLIGFALAVFFATGIVIVGAIYENITLCTLG